MTFGRAASLLCGLAARQLGWRPHEFWTATPAELWACLNEPTSLQEGASRDELQQLMTKFPDRER